MTRMTRRQASPVTRRLWLCAALIIHAACGGAEEPGTLRPLQHRANAAIRIMPSLRSSGASDANSAAPPANVQETSMPGPVVVKGSQSFQADLIHGLADFVVARGKAEVIAYVANDIGQRLCTNQGEWDVRSYFPDTCALLQGKDGVAGFTPRQLGGIFRSALAKDVSRFLPIVLNSGEEFILEASAELGEHRHVIAALLRVLQSFQEGEDPVAMLVASAGELRCTMSRSSADNVACMFKLVATVLRALLATDRDDVTDWRSLRASRLPGDCLGMVAGRRDDGTLFLAEVTRRFERALQKSEPSFRAWVDAHVAPEARCELIRGFVADERLIDVLESLERRFAERIASDQMTLFDSDDVIRQTIELLDIGLRLAGEDRDARAMFDRFQRIWHDFEEWRGVGRAVLALIEGLWRGHDPFELSMAAVAVIPCTEEEDVGCALRAIGLGVRALDDRRRDLKKPIENWTPGEIDETLAATGQELDALVKASRALPLQRWYAANLGSEHWRSRRREFLRQLLGSAARIERILGELKAMKIDKVDKRRLASLELIGASLDLWRVGVTACVGSDKQQRVLAILDEVQAARVAVSRGDVGAFLVSIYAVARNVGIDQPFPPAFEKYMPFMVDILSSRSAGDVRAALEKYAEPVGGWRNKQDRDFQASLTAFLGATAGAEYVAGEGALELGGFAPVGVDLSHRKVGAFISLVDLGTLTTVRLDGGDAELPAITLDQILSPGLYVRVALGKSPFVLGAGASAVRGLRDTAAGDDPIAWRVHAFVGVDITMFQLYSSQ